MPAEEQSDCEIVAADPLQNKAALALAALAWTDEERAVSWRDVRQAAEADRQSVVLLTARKDGQLSAAVLAQILPGQAAVVWLPQFAAAVDPGSLSVALLRELTACLAARGVKFAQALLAPSDIVQGERLTAAGFWQAATLLYLTGEADRFPTQPPELPFELRPATSLNDEQLTALIGKTYEQTLDCPRIDDLRTTADIVRGHRAVGEFRPELWQIVVCDARPAGCLLVNLHPDVKHAELVYLGLIPAVRGRRFGTALTRQALWLARQAGCERLVLAVDAANQPAIRAYGEAGLTAWDRRAIWVHSLFHAQAPPPPEVRDNAKG